MAYADHPIVFIFGCTGTGKSDLAVEIGLKYGGEVVNADSLQVYDELDIACNKITAEEAKGIPHHLLGFVPSTTTDYNVHRYREVALKVIDEIHGKGALPIVVGGTSYYIESLLYEGNLIDTGVDGLVETAPYSSFSNEELHSQLMAVDPESGRRVHPNNRARVWRALQIYLMTGKKKSDHIAQVKETLGTNMGSLRWKNSLLLYLDAPISILNERLDRRVVKMRTGGLRKEIEQFWDKYSTVLKGEQYGILQSIGLKEFLPYLERRAEGSVDENLFTRGIEAVQLHTRQYSNKQRKWVGNRFVKGVEGRENPSFVALDSSIPSKMLSDGVEIVGRFVKGEKMDSWISDESLKESKEEANRLFHCDICNRMITGARNYDIHLKSRPHRKTRESLGRKKKEETDQ